MFRAYGSFPNGATSETKSLRNPLENIQTWGASPIAPPPTPSPSTTSSSPDFHSTSQTTQPNITNQRHNALRQLQQHQQHNQFQNNLHAHNQQHQQQLQQQKSSQNFFIEAALNNNNNNNNNGFKNTDIKGRNKIIILKNLTTFILLL